MAGGETPMTNADFRKLLQTPRRTDAPTPSGGGSKGGVAGTPRRSGGKPGGKPWNKPGKPGAKAAAEEDGEPKYRDRAEERRKGVNPDYATANQFLSVVGADGEHIDASKLSVEESKYLGGDLEHTHLVKGLDYALLNKMRSLAEQKQDEGEQEGPDTAGGAGDGAGAPKGGDRGTGPKDQALSITHPIARGVYTALLMPRRSTVFEQFLPKRTAFVYSFEADDEGLVSDIPTTLRRSKADCPVPPEAVFARVDTSVLERIAKIMSYIKTGKDGKKYKKKERDEALQELVGGGGAGARTGAAAGAPAATGGGKPGAAVAQHGSAKAAAAADEEEDIFADAGTDYKPSVSGKKKPAVSQQQQQQAGGAHEDGEDMEIEDQGGGALPPPPPEPPGGWPRAGDMAQQQADQRDQELRRQQGGLSWLSSQDAGHEGRAALEPQAPVPKWRVRAPRRGEAREVDFVDDAYGEYYPMAGGGEVPTLDDDDDAPPDGKAGKEGEEGGKGGAKGGGKEGGKPSEKGKINTQLQKIQNIFKEKGYEHEDAFGKTPRGGGGGGGKTPARTLATGEDPSLSVNMRKRQRI